MDVLIDDIINITIDDPRWVECAKNAALLIIHTIFIPRKSDKPLKRDDPSHYAILWEKERLMSARPVWDGTSRPVLYGYSYRKKRRQTGYTTLGHI